MADAFSMTFDAKGANDWLDSIAEEAEKAVRPAAQAGAQVLYEEVKLRAPVAKGPKTVKGGRVIQPGALKASIYQAFSRDNSGADHATYHISWNARKAPHGHLVEFGNSRAPAHPFLRPAFDAKAREALTVAEAEFWKRVDPLLKR